jgi:hypothetical protein
MVFNCLLLLLFYSEHAACAPKKDDPGNQTLTCEEGKVCTENCLEVDQILETKKVFEALGQSTEPLDSVISSLRCSKANEFCCASASFGPEPFIMVIGGWDGSSRLHDVEIISIDPKQPVPQCLQQPSSYPLDIAFAAGGELQGVPTVCGGYDPYTDTEACYQYDYNQNSWEKSGSMAEAQFLMGFASDSSWGLVLTGGAASGYSDLVESTSDGKVFRQLQDMPEGVWKHCLAIIDADTLFTAGGHDISSGYGRVNSYLYKKSTDEWIKMADMDHARWGHSCGVIRTTSGQVEIVAVGGLSSGEGWLSSTEIYSVSNNTWRTGNPFPHPITSAGLVQYEDTFIIIGGVGSGYLDTVYEYNIETDSFDPLPVTLKKARYGHIAMAIESSNFPECN